MGPDNPDPSGFRDHGGRILLRHGLADRIIAPADTIDYCDRMVDTGDVNNAANFVRAEE